MFDEGRADRGIKGKFLFRRKEGMSFAEFRAYWLDSHGPKVLRTPEILRYVQSHVIADDALASRLRHTTESPRFTGQTSRRRSDRCGRAR